MPSGRRAYLSDMCIVDKKKTKGGDNNTARRESFESHNVGLVEQRATALNVSCIDKHKCLNARSSDSMRIMTVTAWWQWDHRRLLSILAQVSLLHELTYERPKSQHSECEICWALRKTFVHDMWSAPANVQYGWTFFQLCPFVANFILQSKVN